METVGPLLDLNANPLNAELEVKKLRQLVWKLELQNEQLRNLSGSPPHLLATERDRCRPIRAPSVQSESMLGWLDAPEDQRDGLDRLWAQYRGDGAEPSVLDELELLDLNSLSCADESDETWLYVLSKGQHAEQPFSPLQWCRLGLDTGVSRRSPSQQIEQVSRGHSLLSRSSPATPISPLVRVSPRVRPCSTPQSERHAPSLSSPLHPLLPRTLSPVRKESDRNPSLLPQRHKLRRSLHTVLQAPTMPCFLRCSLSFDSSATMAHLHSSAPAPDRLQRSLTLPPKATTYISPLTSSAPSASQTLTEGSSCLPVLCRTAATCSTTASPNPCHRVGQWRRR